MRIHWLCLFLVCSSSLSLASQNNPIVAGHARFTVLSPEVIRTEYQAQGHFIDQPSLFANARDTSFSDFKVRATRGGVVIETAHTTLTYTDDGHPFSAANLHAMIRFSDGHEAEWNFGMHDAANLGGTRNSLDYVDPATAKVSDGILARDGWYWLDDSARFLLDSHGWVQARPADAGTDGYLFGYGDDYKAGLRALTRAGGAVPMPRKYVLGSWYSRWWPYSSDDYRQIVQEYHDHGFPLDVLVMDMDWHQHDDGWTGLTWDQDLFPDVDDFLGELRDKHIAVTLNDHPQEGVKPDEDRYEQFMHDMGALPNVGLVLPYDAGDENYLTTLFRDTHDPIEEQGVDFWWLDWMGDELPFNRLDWLNEYYYRHSEERGLRGQSFSRWADWGDHRHPIHFSGDTRIEWSTFQYEIPFTASSGNVGCFFWTHDVGGFIGDRSPELLARWTQFAAVSAAMRLHSANHADLDKRPWTYDHDIEASMKVSFRLRAQIMPYVYSTAWKAHQQSLPLIRPLYIEYPKAEEAYHNSQEYLFGDAFLAAPITSQGTGPTKIASQNVWFPEGRWFDWFTGQEYKSGSRVAVSADLNRFPLFARGGMPILMQPFTERPATDPLTTLIVRVYPGVSGEAGQAQLYEDDGVTQGYLHGELRQTKVTYVSNGAAVTIEVSPANGTYPDAPAERSYVIELAQANAARMVSVDGKPADRMEYDSATRTERVFVSPRSVGQGTRVSVVF